MKAGLPIPAAGEYSNEFEKQIFMAINLCRHQPVRFVPAVRRAAKSKQCEAVMPEIVNSLVVHLKQMSPASQVKLEDNAMEACAKNNVSIVEKNEVSPKLGGNVETYELIIGEDNPWLCEEFSMINWESPAADDLVATQLLLDWARDGIKKHKSPILSKSLTYIGVSNKAHKKVLNCI